MDAIVIAGGLGTRLFPLTLSTPKGAIPILDVPLVAYPLALAEEAGCERAVIAGGHLLGRIEQTLLEAMQAKQSGEARLSVSVEFVEEPEPVGTGGAIANVLAKRKIEPPVIVMNGDIVSDVSVNAMLEAHRKASYPATLLTVQVHNPAGLGILEVSEDGIVCSFIEKGEPTDKPPYFINGGIYIFEGEVLDMISSIGGEFALETKIFPRLAEEGKLFAFTHKGFWRDVGTLESYFLTQFDILGYWLTRTRNIFFGQRDEFLLFRDLIYIHKSTKLGENCDLFHRAIVMRDCEIGDGSRLQNTILLPGAKVGKRCELTGVIVDAKTRVSDGSKVSEKILSCDREELLIL